MRFYDIIEKKKNGLELSKDEIQSAIALYTEGKIPDYQMSALLMAIYFRGMTDEECVHLTEAVYRSGDTVDLSMFGELSADKHSSGGVGDKTTLIVAPLAASLGCKVAKMSGRGLGHTGGTVDKLESFNGYNVTLTSEEFIKQVEDIGVAVIGQTGNLTPADKKLYALRDVTATVDSVPLITSSIMGKKLAAGSKNIVLDVKCGSGAFMKTEEEASHLAEGMVKIGRALGRNTVAFVTDMDFPLGYAVGNINEVKEAIEVLSCKASGRLRELSVTLAASMAKCTFGGELSVWKGRAEALLTDGTALKKFKEWISRQGGDTRFIENTDLFPKAKFEVTVTAPSGGYVNACQAELIGKAAMELGAGRRTKDDVIDLTAGINLHVERGSLVREGEPIATLLTSRKEALNTARELVLSAYTIRDAQPPEVPIVLNRFE